MSYADMPDINMSIFLKGQKSYLVIINECNHITRLKRNININMTVIINMIMFLIIVFFKQYHMC